MVGPAAAASPRSEIPVRRCLGSEEEEEEARRLLCTRGQALDDLCFAATHTSVSIFPTGYIPTRSPTPPTSTLRATRAHDADLLIYSFTVPP